MLSLFLNTTVCPPNDAGLGVNAWVPFCPMMLIVGPVAVDGAEGLLLLSPPPQPQPIAAMASPHTVTRKKFICCPLPSKAVEEIRASKTNTSENPWSCVECRGRELLRP